MFGKKSKTKKKGKIRGILDKGMAMYAASPAGVMDMVDLLEMGVKLGGMKKGGKVSKAKKKTKQSGHNRLY